MVISFATKPRSKTTGNQLGLWAWDVFLVRAEESEKLGGLKWWRLNQKLQHNVPTELNVSGDPGDEGAVREFFKL